MAEIVDIFVLLEDEDFAPSVPTWSSARSLGEARGEVGAKYTVLRRSLDCACKGRALGYRMRVQVARRRRDPGPRRPRHRAAGPGPRAATFSRVVVSSARGPAGTWAALRLAEAGVAATILEQGKRVQPRRHDLAQLTRGHLEPRSNYQFGEGGAGTYSDGKLYTRSKDREGVAGVIAELVRFGAPDEIGVESRPHVGSNRLPKVLTTLREHLEGAGVTYRFETSAAGLRVDRGRVRAVLLEGGDEVPADVVVLAVGHSARPVYEWAARAGLALERKGIAVGVRLEHPQPLMSIVCSMAAPPGHPRLPAAFYELTTEAEGAGCLQLLYVPGRLDRARGHRARRRRRQRHEACLGAGSAVRELRLRGLRRSPDVDFDPVRRGRWRASSLSARSKRSAPSWRAAETSGRRRSASATSSRGARARRSGRRAIVRA